MEKFRPWQDLNLQSPVSETDALSIRPQGRCCEGRQKRTSRKTPGNSPVLQDRGTWSKLQQLNKVQIANAKRATSWKCCIRAILPTQYRPNHAAAGTPAAWCKPGPHWQQNLQHQSSQPMRAHLTHWLKWRDCVCSYNSAEPQQLCRKIWGSVCVVSWDWWSRKSWQRRSEGTDSLILSFELSMKGPFCWRLVASKNIITWK